MKNGTVDLNIIEHNYPDSYNYAFEDMATHMFIVKLKLSEPPQRRRYQMAVESDPVIVRQDIDNEYKAGVYVYQAKYLDSKTEIKDYKDKVIKSIREASDTKKTCGLKVTDYIFYVNKQRTQNALSGEIPAPEKEIINAAKEYGINLHWYTSDKIVTDLGTPTYQYIKEMFLCDRNKGSIIFLVGLTMTHYRFAMPAASLDMNLRQCMRTFTPTAKNSGTACFLRRRDQAS